MTEAEKAQRAEANERHFKLIEVASMIAEFGLTLEEAEDIVGVTLGSDPLPNKHVFCPPPDWLAELCAEIQAGWTPQERERRYAGPKQQEWTAPDISSREMGW